MTDNSAPPARTREEIQAEYNQTCFHLGDHIYRKAQLTQEFESAIKHFEAELLKLNFEMRDLNLLEAKVAQAVAEAAKPSDIDPTPNSTLVTELDALEGV